MGDVFHDWNPDPQKSDNSSPVAIRLRPQGFTLIEMIGVLAVIAILSALVLPKVFETMAEAKLISLHLGRQNVGEGHPGLLFRYWIDTAAGCWRHSRYRKFWR